ncbi:Raf kinase inhibitor-like YbhB/YbcL family protein [Erwinia toletana]|uniref:Raf kinase inhibitor-like YbhB/YbcL family protein n=1 Tax=Winslowiella toletana TaxID=92490 RepID=A0ABS4PEU6_9GAMM|nr:YbhB/YbcL family Raf kinase inhibitor-like protein [Winslowiella toletana]MBP2171159.1 Raf kinase inhibitor-like YbhB/YbcL family protein [Winslowiella toletana]
MKKTLLCASLLLATASAGAEQVFSLSSPDFSDNALLAQQFAGATPGNASCTGKNVSPALSWSSAPQGTKSFALLVFDPEGAKGLGVSHLVAYNIPAERSSFAQGELTAGTGYTGGKNTPGNDRYHGPCPPAGSGAHHYVFTLIATDLPASGLQHGLTREALLAKLKGHALGAAGIIGRYSN